MMISVPGEYYVFETEDAPSRISLSLFFQNLGENDILEVRVKPGSPDGYAYHVTRYFLEHELDFMNLALPKGEETFYLASQV